jgi:hypothetical protein
MPNPPQIAGAPPHTTAVIPVQSPTIPGATLVQRATTPWSASSHPTSGSPMMKLMHPILYHLLSFQFFPPFPTEALAGISTRYQLILIKGIKVNVVYQKSKSLSKAKIYYCHKRA